MSEFSVLFVCVGNICRSPTAEAVFVKMSQEGEHATRVTADSAGIAGYHIGEPPDSRAQMTARRRGYDLSALRARKVVRQDFERFDLILAMDRYVLESLQTLCPAGQAERLVLFMDYAQGFTEDEVPDPYYGGQAGFERVLDMIEDGSRGLLEVIAKKLKES